MADDSFSGWWVDGSRSSRESDPLAVRLANTRSPPIHPNSETRTPAQVHPQTEEDGILRPKSSSCSDEEHSNGSNDVPRAVICPHRYRVRPRQRDVNRLPLAGPAHVGSKGADTARFPRTESPVPLPSPSLSASSSAGVEKKKTAPSETWADDLFFNWATNGSDPLPDTPQRSFSVGIAASSVKGYTTGITSPALSSRGINSNEGIGPRSQTPQERPPRDRSASGTRATPSFVATRWQHLSSPTDVSAAGATDSHGVANKPSPNFPSPRAARVGAATASPGWSTFISPSRPEMREGRSLLFQPKDIAGDNVQETSLLHSTRIDSSHGAMSRSSLIPPAVVGASTSRRRTSVNTSPPAQGPPLPPPHDLPPGAHRADAPASHEDSDDESIAVDILSQRSHRSAKPEIPVHHKTAFPHPPPAFGHSYVGELPSHADRENAVKVPRAPRRLSTGAHRSILSRSDSLSGSFTELNVAVHRQGPQLTSVELDPKATEETSDAPRGLLKDKSTKARMKAAQAHLKKLVLPSKSIPHNTQTPHTALLSSSGFSSVQSGEAARSPADGHAHPSDPSSPVPLSSEEHLPIVEAGRRRESSAATASVNNSPWVIGTREAGKKGK